MSMSQQEIEALMNGLDISDDEEEVQETLEEPKVNTEEIEQLISQNNEIKEIIEEPEEENSKVENVDEIIQEMELSQVASEEVSSDDIDELLKEIETPVVQEDIQEEKIEDTFEKAETQEVQSEKVEISNTDTPIIEENENTDEDEIAKNWTNNKIEEGVFPLPADRDTKVVSQLSQVANDSEEKVSQIFDMLSLSLDNNNVLRQEMKDTEDFITSQEELLKSLSSRFPNIKVFEEQLQALEKATQKFESLRNMLNDEDTQIFQAMELMQFNDINRQKIERVMSVIRKLSMYLNNIFEDEEGSKEIAVAKHIHGDHTSDLIGDDLDKLVAEFSNKE